MRAIFHAPLTTPHRLSCSEAAKLFTGEQVEQLTASTRGLDGRRLRW